MDYFEIRIYPALEEKREILTSLLAEAQFESFVETEDELLAYIQINNYFFHVLIINIFNKIFQGISQDFSSLAE